MDTQHKYNLLYAIMAVFAILVIQDLWIQQRSVQPVPYSQLEELLAAGKIKELAIREQYIVGQLKERDENGKSTVIANRVDPKLAEQLAHYKVPFSQVHESKVFVTLLSWILPALIFVGIWLFVFRKFAEKQGMGGGMMSVGKSKAKVYVERDTGIGFADVAGVDEAKAELVEIIDFLKDQEAYGKLGARLPKGILLVGPPGTGKTMLARAVAGEARVPFFSISGSEFVEMFVGVGAARVRDLFEQARKSAPAIIFIDELDALGRSRSVGGPGGHDEREQTLNQLLVELDGFDPSSGLVLLAATNRPEILDPALLRAGRFDRQVLVDRPDKAGRIAILEVYLVKIKKGADVDPAQVADLTTGFSGADLANLVNEAALLATRRGAEQVAMDDFTQAVERIIAGLEKKNRLINPREREIVAFHEVGHALVALAQPGADPVHKISIIPRGVGALGYTLQRPTEDRFLMTRQELLNKICVLLGGRAAETLVFDHLSTGAADDLAKTTDIARSMVTRYGMDAEIGHVVYEESQPTFLGQEGLRPPSSSAQLSDQTAQQIDGAIRQIINDAMAATLQLLAANRSTLDHCAKVLLEQETLGEDEIKELTRGLIAAERPA
ncbi:MAG: ATP-dependent zinc metalloprotease FtsH [Thermodesulfobacteriota bacterium]